jgi:PTS system nitrogen regulatory IIA component
VSLKQEQQTMNLEELIKPDSILCNVSARSKKHCLEILSELLTRSIPDIANEEVFARLIERERLGCTCLDKGVAFPHCRISGLPKSCAALMRLTEPVDFDSSDGESVDLVFGLMVPENLTAEDLADIDMITSLLRDDALCARLRAATSSHELNHALLTGQLEPVAKLKSAQQG